MATNENLANLLTPGSPGAIAVVRLLGPLVAPFLERHFSKKAIPGRCVHGTLSDGTRVIDDPVVVLHPQGACADINLHGGSWVIRSLLELAAKNGFQLAEYSADPTSLDLLDGDTMIEREINAALPAARTELGLRVLLAQVNAWAHLIAGNPSPDDLGKVLADQSLDYLLHPPSVAIIGPANAGKSTLANQLFGQERSITADVPGTTRDWVGEIANIDGLPVMLVDTPGMRATQDAIEQASIERSRGRVESADLVVLVLDAARPLEPEQVPLLAAYPNAMKVINKCDRVWAWNEAEADGIHTVATTGVGVDALRHAIATTFGCAEIDLLTPRCWTERQRRILAEAVVRPEALGELNSGAIGVGRA